MKRQVLTVMFLFFLMAGRSSATGFTDWLYARQLTLSTATLTNNYQVRIDLTTNNFDYAHCDSAGNDLRFEDTNTQQSLSYWIQTWNNVGTSIVWVAVSNAGTTGIKLYYGKTGAAASSSGTNTFIFFDDFDDGVIDTARWTVGGAMTEVGGYATGAASGSDYFFGKTRIPIDTLTCVRMRNRAAPNVQIARPAVLASNGNPYLTVGFGWQDFSDGNRYTDTYDAGITQNSIGAYNAGWYNLETIWQTGIVKFYANSSLLITHNTQIPIASRVLYEQVDGNADYDFIYARRYISPEPATTVGAEQSNFIAGAPVIANVGAANIQGDSADLVGNLVTGDAPVTVVCYWGTNDGGSTASAWMTNNNLGVQSLGYMTNPVTGLAAGQVYSFRYYATNSVGGSWASGSTTFSTLGAPTVDNDGGAASVGQTSAQLQGTVLGGNPNPNVWIYWGTTDGGTTPGLWNRGALDLGSSSLGGFSTNVTGLLANQTCWYRCFASNSYGTAWAGSSTNFTTATPSLTINNIGLFEGAQGVTNTATFIVTLSTTSAVDVSVSYASSNGTATVANNDYVATNGTLTIPAGSLTGSIPVQVVGDNVYEADEVFYVNLSNGVNVTLTGRQGACTITNDDFTFYVRGDVSGSDANGGGTWNDAWATLQKVMDTVPYNVPITANVQASIGAQTYAVCSRAIGYYVNGGPLRAFTVNFQGGWQNVDTTPEQTGLSTVTSAAINQDGIAVISPDHNERATLDVNRFRLIQCGKWYLLLCGANLNYCGCTLTVSNTTIHAKNYGVYLSYPVYYPYITFGGPTKVIAKNVDIVAGLGGAGDGIYSYGAWLGSSVGADGTNEVTGEARVSSITSSNGCGVNCVASVSGNGAHGILFSNVVIYGCSNNAIQLSAVAPDPVQALLRNCTIADNGGDGLGITGGAAGSWGNATNCIFANNGGHGINLGVVAGPAFVCSEGYNVFFNDDILTNGVVKTLAGSSSAADPLFRARLPGRLHGTPSGRRPVRLFSVALTAVIEGRIRRIRLPRELLIFIQ